jgi:hypothetical protein
MEAIAALSLACNVLQLVSSTHELIGLCYNTYHDKSPQPDSATKLSQLTQMLQRLDIEVNSGLDSTAHISHAQGSPSQQPNGTALADLRNLAESIRSEANELQGMLTKVCPPASPNLLSSAQTSLKYMFKYKDKIVSLQGRVQRSRSTLNSELLWRLW